MEEGLVSVMVMPERKKEKGFSEQNRAKSTDKETIRNAVLKALKNRKDPASPKELAAETGLNYNSIRRVLQELLTEGKAESPERGRYTASPLERDAPEQGGSTLRNHHYDKFQFQEPGVSSNVQVEKARPKTKTGSYRSLLGLIDDWNSKYANVQEMLSYLQFKKSGSPQSARTHCHVLASFCRYWGLDVGKLVELSREKIEDLIQRYCDFLVQKSRLRGASTKYPNTVLACLKTFFTRNGFNSKNGLELRVEGYHQPPRTTNRPEYIPTLKEALTMAERCGSKRDRAIVLTLITTGLRNSSLRAMLVGDILVELREEKRNLWINIDAEWNKRIAGACKNCIPYYTFTAKAATEAISSMLRERETTFGSHSPEEPLFISNYNQVQRIKRRMKSLSSRELQIIVKKAAKAADITDWQNVHVHTMRKVLESVLRSPPCDGTRMDPKDQEFLMGHLLPGSQDNYYDRTKIEQVRERYSKLVFEDRPPGQEVSLQTVRKIAKIMGVDLLHVKAAKEKELGRSLSFQEEEEILEQEIKLVRGTQNRQEQRIVAIGDLEDYIQSGWGFVSVLPNEKAVISREMQPQ